MEAKTFILTNSKVWRRQVRVFVMNHNKKYEERLLPFTTEHVVSTKLRTERGRKVPAEFTTQDPIIIEALYRDSAYGKDFIEKGDAEAKKKQPTIVISDKDRQLVALRGLFNVAGLFLDENLPYEVLKEQYEIHMTALSGKKMEKSTVTEIPHVPVDVKANIEAGVNAARQAYEEKYGEPIPAIVENDLGFLDALANPAFDAQEYIAKKKAEAENPSEVKTEDEPAETKESLHQKYFEKTGKNVPTPKVNDLAWIKAKLEE